jgi:hypothetical protein
MTPQFVAWHNRTKACRGIESSEKRRSLGLAALTFSIPLDFEARWSIDCIVTPEEMQKAPLATAPFVLVS